jgi:4-amino-4-deoxy-L-arabinose transferase-like glycosyltransferase
MTTAKVPEEGDALFPNWFLPTFLTLYALSHLLGLGIMEYRGEESRRVLVSLEMLLSGQYLQPTLSGWPYYNKPPLFNWMLAGWMELVGTESRALLRLPSILAIGLVGWLTYRVVRRELSRDTALLASLIWLTGAELYFYGSLLALEMDLLYALVVTGQWLIFYTGWRSNRLLTAFAGSYLLMAVGFMMKGLPSPVFQALTIPVWLWSVGQLRLLWSRAHLMGLALGLIGSMGYFYWLHLQGGDAGTYLFKLLAESSQKSAGEGSLLQILVQTISFPVKFIQLLAPWIIALAFIRWRTSWQWFWDTPLLRFFALTFVANILIYWISPGTRCRYLYMFVPLMAVPLAAAWLRTGRPDRRLVMGLALGMTILRLGYDLFLLPVQQANLKNQQQYMGYVDQIARQAPLEDLIYTGIPDTLYVQPHIGPWYLWRDTLLTAPEVPYLTLLELTRRRGTVLPFDTLDAPAGSWLLSNDSTDCRRPGAPRFPTFDGEFLTLCRE